MIRFGYARAAKTYETGGIVVTHGLGVTERFKHRVSLDDLVFEGPLLQFFFGFLARRADGGEVRDYLLRVLSLTSTRLTTAMTKRSDSSYFTMKMNTN